jgi:hypothetical protein
MLPMHASTISSQLPEETVCIVRPNFFFHWITSQVRWVCFVGSCMQASTVAYVDL